MPLPAFVPPDECAAQEPAHRWAASYVALVWPDVADLLLLRRDGLPLPSRARMRAALAHVDVSAPHPAHPLAYLAFIFFQICLGLTMCPP